MIELVVVVAIIVLLVGMTVSVGVNVVEKSEVRQTQNIIQLLDTAVQEWELAADRKLSYGMDGQGHSFADPRATYDVQSSSPHVLMLPDLLATVSGSPAAKRIIASIDPDRVYRFDTTAPMPRWLGGDDPDDPDGRALNASLFYGTGTYNDGQPLSGLLTVFDAWGNPLRVVHPGVVVPIAYSGSSGYTIDTDGTLRTDNENVYGVAMSRQICFVSAGPDGKFGDVSEPPDTRLFKQTLDNIYSYRLVQYEEDEDEPVWTGPDFIAPDPEARP
ncbi:MAG: hypothetical protein HRT77_17535 [Halioglobus sp.]|nr:hypothetical protein [Halioglobus sp.]